MTIGVHDLPAMHFRLSVNPNDMANFITCGRFTVLGLARSLLLLYLIFGVPRTFTGSDASKLVRRCGGEEEEAGLLAAP